MKGALVPRQAPARVLIVDDEVRNRQLLEIMLGTQGYDILACSTGEQALALVAQHPPDIVLLDIMMPGMAGYEAAVALKADPATVNIPIIMISALGDREARIRGLASGAEDFITKPVDRAELCSRVKNLLRLKAYGDHFDQYSRALEHEVSANTADLKARAEVLEQQAALLDLAPDAIIVRDMETRILFWSRGAESLYGWNSDEAIGEIATDFLGTELPLPMAAIQEILLREGRWEGEVIQRKRDGTRIVASTRWATQLDRHGEPVRVLTINNDITTRKQTEAELAILTERLSLATDVARVGVWEWDLATDQMVWDTTMFTMYGLTPALPMPYQAWSTMVFPDDLPAVEAILRKAIEEKGQETAEFRIRRADGVTRILAAVERAVLDERGGVVRVIGVNVDITDTRLAEQALEKMNQDQLRFKDEFLSHVSHELRSPLTAIKQFTTILLGGLAGELNKEQQSYQEIVLKNIRQLQALIDDLLEVTRLETGKLTIDLGSVPATNVVTDTFDTLQGTATARGVTLACDFAPDLPCAHADQTRLRQILIILVDNAIKFSHERGEVKITVRRSLEDSRFLRFEVADTGRGIDTGIADRIFERLYQVSDSVRGSRKGLGLGLFICKELVTRQGGEIAVHSTPGLGTTFTFTMPVFSLENCLTPLRKGDGWPAESVSLLMVETHTEGIWSTREAREEWHHEAGRLLRGCMLPDLDVLLPAWGDHKEDAQFFIAAFANGSGAEVLAERIRGQFRKFLEARQGMRVTVSSRLLSPIPRDLVPVLMREVSAMAATSSPQPPFIPDRMAIPT